MAPNGRRTKPIKRMRTSVFENPHPRQQVVWPGIDSGLITAALKARRKPILERFSTEIEDMYLGH